MLHLQQLNMVESGWIFVGIELVLQILWLVLKKVNSCFLGFSIMLFLVPCSSGIVLLFLA
jgi:hypothetical protein